MAQPRFLDNPSFRALRLGDLEEFNRHVAGSKQVDLSNADLRGVDFRGVAEIGKLNVRGAYLRNADLRGLDLRGWDMEGCSLYHAQVSGTFFPVNLSPEEIVMSLEHGTRMRAIG